MPNLRQTWLVVVAGLLVAEPAYGQAERRASDQGTGAWNSERALELIERGRARRDRLEADSAMQGYRAIARGHLYFMVDRADTDERTLVKADQLAIQLYWKAPDLVRQRIVGRRDERKLPTNIKYHLDHLTVVTDDFDDRITLGDGDEIRSVLHPLAPGSEATYDVRLADSLTIRFAGRDGSVRVYELEVRPKESGEPGFVGSLFLDRATGGVVRMSFTFTPAAYVDPYLDYIRISLDNGRWLGRYWLPHRQEVEIRRELPQLDFPAGSVIQGRWEIGDYHFNPGLSRSFFGGPVVTRVPDEILESYAFDEGLYEPLETEGLVSPPSVEEIRRRAGRLAAEQYLSGLRPLRLFLPSASSALRYNRAEGLFVGGGFSWEPRTDLGLATHGGYAVGRARPSLSVRVSGGGRRPGTSVRAYLEDLRDLGPVIGASGVGNSFSVAALTTDYLDPYFASGVSVSHRLGSDEGPRLEMGLHWEEHEAGRVVLDPQEGRARYRPVRPIEEGVTRSAEVAGLLGSEERGLSTRVGLSAGTFDGEGYGEIRARASWTRRWLKEDVELTAELQGGALTGGSPLQALYHLGGRSTLPGYDYRGFAGDRFVLVQTSAAWGVASPWLRPRIFGSAGRTALERHSLPPEWNARATPVTLFSAGVGVGLFWDILQVRAGRGLNGGEWEWVVSIQKRLWPYL